MDKLKWEAFEFPRIYLVTQAFFNRSQIKKRVSDIADQKIDALAKLWEGLFEPDIGCDHLDKLIEHCDAFFNDVISETQDRKSAIEKRIECKLRVCFSDVWLLYFIIFKA